MRHKISCLGIALGLVASLLMVSAGQVLATAPTSAPTILSPSDGSTVGAANPTLSWSAVGNAAKYRVQIATSLTFSSPIYSIETPGLTATPQSQLPFSQLYWRVAGEDSGGLTGPYTVASFSKTLGSAPTPLTPTNAQTLTFPTDPVVFSWLPVAGAVSYTIQIGNSSDFTGATQDTTSNTSYTLLNTQSFTLSDGVTPQSWWWQVQATYANSSVTAWSTPRSYQIIWPATPQLESPANGAVGVIDTVFSWDPVPGAASYDIQVSPNGDWQNNKVIDRTGVLSTRYAPDQTLDNSSYYWRVRARAAGSAANYGQWSSAFSFTRSWPTRPVTINPSWPGGAADPPIVSNLEFSWTPAAASGAGWVDHASHYEIWIGTDVNFSPGTYMQCTTDQTTYTPYGAVTGGNEPPGTCNMSLSVNPGTVYYWRVRAIDGLQQVLGLWNSTSSDDTQRFIYLPSLPDLSCGPSGGVSVQTPVLCWSPVSGAEQYRVTIRRHDGTIFDQMLTWGLSYTTYKAFTPSEGPFTWNVETVDAQGHYGITRASWPSFNVVAPTTDTSLTLLSPATNAHTVRMPSMTWTPYTGAAYYKVLYGVTAGIFDSTPLNGSTNLYNAGFTRWDRPLSAGHYYWLVEAFDGSNNVLASSSMGQFYVGTTPAAGNWIVPWNNYLTPECTAQTDPSVVRCTPLVGQTQELSWGKDDNAGAYVVYVAKDVNFTNIYRVYETGQTSLTPRESWLDSQAGQSYYWFVRPCADWALAHCGPGPDTNAGLENASAYRKSSPATTGLTTTTADNPPVATTTIPDQVTFNWADYMTTSQASAYPVSGAISTRVTQEARNYIITVSTTSDFAVTLDSRAVDQIQYTPWAMTYPEGPLYWKVQALDGSGNPLTMSATGTVVKSSARVSLTSPADGANVSGVPYFTWEPQNWAGRYNIEIYKNGDLNFSGANRIDQKYTPNTGYSPKGTMAAGVYAWRVQRLDAGDRPGPWSIGRTFTLHPAAPGLNTPADLALLDGSNLSFTWNGVQGAVSYQFQSSTTADFASLAENVTTVMTAWSPTFQYPANTYYWRVNLLDASNNVLSTSSVRQFSVGTMPGRPTSPVAVGGNASATVSWTAPASSGSSPITGYIVTSTPGGKTCTTTGLTHCTVSGLTNGLSYTFAVQAITDFGTGPASVDSNAVVPSAVSVLTVTSGLNQNPNVAFNVVVTSTDGLGSTETGYRGTVHFTSSDPAAVLPANYTFTGADLGTHTFSVTLNTLGTQSITATDTVTGTLTGTQAGINVEYLASTYVALPDPRRILDTRRSDLSLVGTFKAGTVRTFGVTNVPYVGADGKPTATVAVPLAATAVTGNLTIVNETASGLVALGPTMTATGAVTTINFAKPAIRANNVTVGLGPGGTLQAVYRAPAGNSVHIIFDVTGYFLPDTSGSTYHTVTPGRVLDSRPTTSGHTNIGTKGKFLNQAHKSFNVVGVVGIGWTTAQVPAGAVAVTGNLTVTSATTDGYVALGPTMTNTPKTSTVNVAAGTSCANGVTVGLSGGKLDAVWVGKTGSSADVIFDVTGYFTADLTGLRFHPIVPARYLDSSINQGLSGGFGNRTARQLTVGGLGAVPADAAGISGNLTVVNPSSAGYAFISPGRVDAPTSSTVNVAIHQTAANGLDVALTGGRLWLIWVGTTGSTTHLQLDVTGYWK
jgi:large repetitive protein